jgi:alpha,alpha-trehalose phosphorylase
VIGDDAFPVEPWCLRETSLRLDLLAQAESLFALGNGHLGMRGNFDEGEPRALSGTYLNGFYESYPLEYGERGYGFAEDGQVVVDVPDGKIIRLLVEDEPLDIHRGRLEHHERRLDFRSGVLERKLEWSSQGGHTVRVTSRRIVSFELRSVAVISYEVEAVDGPVRIALQSNLLANQPQADRADDPRVARNLGPVLHSKILSDHGMRVVMGHATARSGLQVASGMDHVIEHDGEVRSLTQTDPDLGRVTITAQLEPGRPLRLVKYLAYHWSSQQSIDWLRDQADASLGIAMDEGFEGIAASQRRVLDDYWAVADVELDGDDEIQQGLRYALFHLLQASARAETRAIAAKGLTGTGYDGHAFWDTESFVLPVLTYGRPDLVRDALIWRWSILPQARERAHQLGLPGASMPWRTIHGEECSGYWPAGSAALHVNASVADAVRRYVFATGDEDFEREYGLELLVEIARMWTGAGHFYGGDSGDGSFRIHGVTGPDEYSALVDDNVYTNLMAASNLWVAADAVGRHPDTAAHLGVGEHEPALWRRAAKAMYVPYDEQLGVHSQDQEFTRHDVWDFESTPPDDYPLLLHHPYIQLYRKQVVKQADLVLALLMRGDRFSAEEKLRNFDYYEALTVRDSSLSACVQAVVAAEVGHLQLAHDYLAEAALMDIRDLHNNVRDGLHIASLGGALLAAVCGIGGMRDNGRLSFAPRLPETLTRLCFPVVFRGRRLTVEVREGAVTYALDEGDAPLEVLHWGETVELTPGESTSRDVPPAPELPPPRQPPGREPARARERMAGQAIPDTHDAGTA